MWQAPATIFMHRMGPHKEHVGSGDPTPFAKYQGFGRAFKHMNYGVAQSLGGAGRPVKCSSRPQKGNDIEYEMHSFIRQCVEEYCELANV